MIERGNVWLYVVMGVALGLAALFSELVILRVLGAVSLVAAAGFWYSHRRLVDGGEEGPSLRRMPSVSMAERWLPWVFLTVAALSVLAAAFYAWRQLSVP